MSCLFVITLTVTVYGVLVQTIPSVVNSGTSVAISECPSLTIYPAGATTGSSGNATVSCPNNIGAILFHPGTATPTFSLAVGYSQIALVWHKSPIQCNFAFASIPGTTVPSGVNLTSSGPLTFSANPTVGQFLTGAYDYCLRYDNAPSLGLGSFTVTWS